MQKFALVLLVSRMCLAAPQIGFGDASPDEIAEIRAGTYLETFDDNPVYNFNYKVADDVEQTYMAMNENRDGEQVTGSYQYVDPYGSLIVVTYTAGPMGYTESREVQEGFVKINAKAQKATSSSSSSGSTSFNSGASSSNFGSGSSSSFGSGASSSNFGSGSSSSNFGSGSSSSNFGSGSSSTFGSGSSSNFGSSQTTQTSSFNANDIVSQVVSQVQPLISQTVSSAVSGSRRPVVAPAPVVQSNDIVSQVVSDISPLVSQTVSSALSGSSGSRFSSSRPAPAPRAPAPRPILAPAAVSSSSTASSSRTSGSVTDLFGTGGNFNVRFNTPSFNIEY